MENKKEVTLSELRDMYLQDPDKIYIVDLHEMVGETEGKHEKDTGNR